MNRLACALACTLPLWIMKQRADAADFATTQDIIAYRGDVEEGDDVTLSTIIARMNARGVKPRLLSIAYSPGGATDVSIRMAQTLRANGIGTEVYGRCSSACVTIFSGGLTRRLIKPNGQLNVHSARDPDTQAGASAGENQSSRANSQRLARFLVYLGAPYSVAGKLVATPPSTVTTIDDAELEAWHVEVVFRR